MDTSKRPLDAGSSEDDEPSTVKRRLDVGSLPCGPPVARTGTGDTVSCTTGEDGDDCEAPGVAPDDGLAMLIREEGTVAVLPSLRVRHIRLGGFGERSKQPFCACRP